MAYACQGDNPEPTFRAVASAPPTVGLDKPCPAPVGCASPVRERSDDRTPPRSGRGRSLGGFFIAPGSLVISCFAFNPFLSPTVLGPWWAHGWRTAGYLRSPSVRRKVGRESPAGSDFKNGSPVKKGGILAAVSGLPGKYPLGRRLGDGWHGLRGKGKDGRSRGVPPTPRTRGTKSTSFARAKRSSR